MEFSARRNNIFTSVTTFKKHLYKFDLHATSDMLLNFLNLLVYACINTASTKWLTT